MTLTTARLDLVPATPAIVRAALEDDRSLAAALGAALAPTWPPEHYDRGVLDHTLQRLEAGPEQAGWQLYFLVLRAEGDQPATVIGHGGYKGPPDDAGTVEIGYSVVAGHRRRGYASEAVHGLLARAFAHPRVVRVVAETYPALAGSIGVLDRAGFRYVGEGSEPGVVRYELERTDAERAGTG